MGVNINSASAWMSVTGSPVIAGNTNQDVKLRWDNDQSTLSTIIINEELTANASIGIWTDQTTSNAGGDYSGNELLGTDAATTTPSNCYTLSRGSEGTGDLGFINHHLIGCTNCTDG